MRRLAFQSGNWVSSKKFWPVLFLAVTLVIWVLAWLFDAQEGKVISDIQHGNYGNRTYFYWGFYYSPHPSVLVIPISSLIFFALWCFRSSRPLSLRRNPLVFGTFIILFALTLFLFGFSLLALRIYREPGDTQTHISSVQIGDKTFHLSRIISIGNTTYVLHECDKWGWMCHVAYTQDYNMRTGFRTMQFIVGLHELGFVIDGEIVYTYQPNEFHR